MRANPVDRFLEAVQTAGFADTDAFADGAISDTTVPNWRLPGAAATAMPGGYVNFSSDDDPAQIRANYQHNHRRLVEVKGRYDPDNLFRVNQNIPPATADPDDRELTALPNPLARR